MKIRLAPELRDEILGALRWRGNTRDTDGLVHVSDLQYCLLKRSLRDLWPVKDSDKQTMKYATGKSVHETMEAIREWRAVTETPVERDGIIGTPDIMESDRVVEVKSTWKSLRQFTEDFGRAGESYIDQAKTYCCMTDPILTKAQIDVVCLCGDYTFPLSPELITAEAEFSIFELNHHWNTVTRRRDRLNELYVQVMDKMGPLATREGDDVPDISLSEYMGWTTAGDHPFSSVIGYEWECEYCPYLEQCRPPVIYAAIKQREAEAKFKADNKVEIAAEKLRKREEKEAVKAEKARLKLLKAEEKAAKLAKKESK